MAAPQKKSAKKTAKQPASKRAAAKRPGKNTGGKARLISSKVAYKGPVFSVNSDMVEEANGFVHQRDVIRHNGSVVILAVDDSEDTKDPIVILERQYRHAAGQFLFELPAGRVEPGEAPLAAAKREMIEETGYRARQWKLLTKYFASPGFLGEWMQIYLARQIRPGVAQPEADEQIEIRRLKLSEAMTLVHSNKIHDGKTLIGLLLFDAALRDGRLSA